MDLITLGRTLGFSVTAGINLYATVALIGLSVRYDWVDLPPQFAVFDNDLVIGVAVVFFLLEFFADKIPWVDSLWDAIHTVVRPLGGALIAVAALGEASPTVQGLVALLGGGVAATSHFAKAGTRAVVNTSPEPVSNSVVSLLEDIFVFALVALSFAVPILALVVSIMVLAAIFYFSARLIRAIRLHRQSVPS